MDFKSGETEVIYTDHNLVKFGLLADMNRIHKASMTTTLQEEILHRDTLDQRLLNICRLTF